MKIEKLRHIVNVIGHCLLKVRHYIIRVLHSQHSE